MKTGVKTMAPMNGMAVAGRNHHIQAGDTALVTGTMTDMDIDGTLVTGINKKNCVIGRRACRKHALFYADFLENAQNAKKTILAF